MRVALLDLIIIDVVQSKPAGSFSRIFGCYVRVYWHNITNSWFGTEEKCLGLCLTAIHHWLMMSCVIGFCMVANI